MRCDSSYLLSVAGLVDEEKLIQGSILILDRFPIVPSCVWAFYGLLAKLIAGVMIRPLDQ